jgi:FtsZ-interacting cell division protein ZipA
MDTSTIIWIVVAIVVLAIVVWFLLRRSRAMKEKRLQHQRDEATELRRTAESERIEVQEREASAAKVDAEARLAQAEADRKAAEAARLQQEAQERSEQVGERRTHVEDRLRRADEVDPDHPGPDAQRRGDDPDTEGRHRA